jgi:glycosyltransferase involved in cell wall biosynthesis
MAAGKPVVASSVGGVPELIEDQVTGLLVPPRDPAVLARAISQLLSDRAFARQLAERAREEVKRHFTVEQMAKQNEEYYHELLRQQRSGGYAQPEVIQIGS